MVIIILFALFESQIFPYSIFLENQYNPASHFQKGVFINFGTGTRFCLSELRTYSIYTKIKSYSIHATSFGNDIYRENIISAGMSIQVVDKVIAGFGIAMLNYWIGNYCNRFGYSVKIGGLYHNKSTEIGGWINNINIPRFSDVDYLPPSYSLRFKYVTSNNVSLIFALRGLESDLPFFNIGVSCMPSKIITLGTGVNTDPLYLEYIIQLNLNTFILRYAGNNQRHLGLSHFLGLCFNP